MNVEQSSNYLFIISWKKCTVFFLTRQTIIPNNRFVCSTFWLTSFPSRAGSLKRHSSTTENVRRYFLHLKSYKRQIKKSTQSHISHGHFVNSTNQWDNSESSEEHWMVKGTTFTWGVNNEGAWGAARQSRRERLCGRVCEPRARWSEHLTLDLLWCEHRMPAGGWGVDSTRGDVFCSPSASCKL